MSKTYRLPFDLPPAIDYELILDPAEIAAMLRSDDPTEVEAAQLMAGEWTARADKAKTEPVFAVLIPRRLGLSAAESKRIDNESAKARKIALAMYSLIDRIAIDQEDKSVEQIHQDVMAFSQSNYLPPYLRPYLDDLINIDDEGIQTHQEKLATIHMQRAIPEWQIAHTQSLKHKMVESLLDYARLEEEGSPPHPKSEPEQT